MSFCPIDEAFGTFLSDDLNPNPIESSQFQNMDSQTCEKKQHLKKKRTNCNKQNTRFTSNVNDLYDLAPTITQHDSDFDESMDEYNPYDVYDLYDIRAESPITSQKQNTKQYKNKRNY